MTVRGSGGEERTERRLNKTPGIVMTLAGIGFLTLVATQWQSKQTIDSVVVRGASGLSRTAVEAIVDTFRMREVGTVVFADVRGMVERLPYVREANVFLSGVCNLTIDVVECIPVAHVVMPNGELRYVDAQGIVLPPPPQRVGFNIPLIRMKDEGAVKETDVAAIARIVFTASTMLDPVLYQSVSEVCFDARRRCVDLVADGVTWHMNVSDGKRMKGTLADMNVFWRQIASRVPPQGAEIDLTWRHQVVVRQHGIRPAMRPAFRSAVASSPQPVNALRLPT